MILTVEPKCRWRQPAVDQEEREAAATAKMYEILLSLPEVPPELVDDGASKLSPAELKELISKLWNRRQVRGSVCTRSLFLVKPFARELRSTLSTAREKAP